ncbi:hypothetical protein EVG20_g6356 [Dentipellis fragilis]|uniref:DUF155 domain-containing protein n=1 Tax=Dentipellis fragilis TaxID=205917 RepID=A0A4Y9YL86_9AGAM|nr:hypothetical protein EVG20_g6356 [Dentipellis fragilis]
MSRPSVPLPIPPRSARLPSDRQTGPLRRASFSLPKPAIPASGATPAAAAQRTSKSTQKLVLLPSDPQTKPLLPANDDEAHGYETDAGVRVREHKSAAERMSKADRRRAGYRRITAYCVAESFRLKLLASFLKREHNVSPRAYDDALYAFLQMYHLPLLPGYGPDTNIRSSAPPPPPPSQPAEPETDASHPIMSSSLQQVTTDAETETEAEPQTDAEREPKTETETEIELPTEPTSPTQPAAVQLEIPSPYIIPMPGDVLSPPLEPAPLVLPIVATPEVPAPAPNATAEIVFLAYGVVVFFGLSEGEERALIEDLDAAGVVRRRRPEADWEIEECHYVYDSSIAYPRIYNDFFTLKSPSSLLTLSIAHALAQSTLLAHHESFATSILSSPTTLAIPRTLARTGALQLGRTAAMKLTGRLFRLRRDVILGTNVLDVPGMFWEEGEGPRAVYDRVREYFEIGERVQALNERITGANDLLDAIHDHLNNKSMERITWIIIWLIVVAIMVDLGEILARLIVHATTANADSVVTSVSAPVSFAVPAALSNVNISSLSHAEALRLLERVVRGGSELEL